MESVLLSLAGMALTAIVAYIGAQRGVATQLAKLDAKVEQLSIRVEKHNCLVERTAALEERVRWMEEELRHR